MPISQLSAILLSLFLFLLPAGIWTEQTYTDAWPSRLFESEPEEKIEPDTPLFISGTFLPNTISQSTTLSASDSPIILNGATTISPSGSLTLLPGTRIFTGKMSRLIVEGTLNINGADRRPVTFTTNEKYSDDQTWLGITVEASGRANIKQTVIKYGSPGLTCLKDSTASINNSTIAIGSLGIYTETTNCAITNSVIQDVRDGIISIGAKPTLNNVDITATLKNTINFKKLIIDN